LQDSGVPRLRVSATVFFLDDRVGARSFWASEAERDRLVVDGLRLAFFSASSKADFKISRLFSRHFLVAASMLN
jgi:hypothetical protein